jgi:hypothetical protein
MIRRTLAALLSLGLTASFAHAGTLFDPSAAGIEPRVPISAFGNPASWFDPSQLHLATSISVGGGFSGGTSALQVTSLSYQFKAPVSMSVSVGNAFGPSAAQSGSSVFLEGLNVAWRPSANSIVRLEYHDVRSPLQYGYYGSRYGLYDPYAWTR